MESEPVWWWFVSDHVGVVAAVTTLVGVTAAETLVTQLVQRQILF